MSYINDSFNLELDLTAQSGLASGVALLFLFSSVSAAILHGLVCKSLHRQMALVTLKSWLEARGGGLGAYCSPSVLQLLLDLLLVGCFLLLISTAVVSDAPSSACTIFFVGSVYIAAFMVLFSVSGNGFQLINSTAFVYFRSALAFYGVFVLVQLLAVGSGVEYSYRALGALWMGLSFLPFFLVHPLQKNNVDGDVFPAPPFNCTCLVLEGTGYVRKLVGILHAPGSRWLTSLVPVLVFAVYSAKKSVSSGSEAGVYVLITVVVTEAFFQLTGEKIEDHLQLVVVSRFVLVLVGQRFWLVGVVWAALCVASLNLKVCIDCTLPAARSRHLGDLIHRALEELGPATVNVLPEGGNSTAVTSTRDEKDVEIISNEPVCAKKISAFLRENPSISLLGMQVFVAIAMGVASFSPSSLSVDTVDGSSQLAWAGCFWIIWAAASVNYLCYRVVVRNGLGRSIAQTISSYVGIPTGDGDAPDEQQDVLDPNPSCISATLAVVADCVKEGIDDRQLVGALCVLAWSTTVGATILAAFITNTWVAVPLVALLPPAAKIFYNFLRCWEDAGCPFQLPRQPLHKNWLPALALFTLSIGLACIPSSTSFFIPIYLGLFLIAAATNALNIVYWRCNLKADCLLVALLLISWVPTVVWSIIFGVRSRTLGALAAATSHSAELVVMLLFACTAVQLLFLSFVVWRDYSKNGVGGSDGARGIHAKEGLQPQVFLKFLLSAAFVILAVLCSVFAATISTPLGVAFLVLLMAASLTTALKIGFIDASDACCVGCASTNRKCNISLQTVAIAAILCVVISGVVGSVVYPTHAFWWASFSWLTLASSALAYGVTDHLNSPPKIHGVFFYPVYSFDLASNTVLNVSLQSSSILLFLLMLSLYSVWCSIIVLPFESGLVMFLVTNTVLALYVRLVCGSAARDGIDDEILTAAKSEGYARIYLQAECDEEEEEEAKDPSRSGEAETKKQDVEILLAGKIQERRKAEENFHSLLARHSAAFFELSPWPFVYLLSHLVCDPDKKVQDNPIVDVESQTLGGQGQAKKVDLATAVVQLQEFHDDLLSKAADLSRWRAYTLLKANIQAEEAALRRTSQLLAFLRSTANDERFSAEQRDELRALTADQLLRKFPPQALAALLDAFHAYQLAEEARRKEAERKRLEKEAEEMAAKREVLRLADEERRRAREKPELERQARHNLKKQVEAAALAAEELRTRVLVEGEEEKRKMQERHERELDEEKIKAEAEAEAELAERARVAAEQEAVQREIERITVMQSQEQEQRRKQEEVESRQKREEEFEAAALVAEEMRKRVLAEAEEERRKMQERHERELEEEKIKVKAEAERAAKARVAAEQDAADKETERRRIAEMQVREQEQRRKQEEVAVAESRQKREEEVEAATRAAEKLRQEHLDAEKKIAEAQRRPEAAAKMQGDVLMEVVGRYGVPLGNLSDVINSLELSGRFDDEDFDIAQKEAVLGGELAKKHENAKVIRLTDKYKEQISQCQQYEQGCFGLIDPRQINQGQAGIFLSRASVATRAIFHHTLINPK